MMQRTNIWSLLAMVCSLCACSTDIDLEAPAQDIPVVYGLLSRQDTAHYVRIERAFLQGSSEAAEVAQNPDSLYYPELTVRLNKAIGGPSFALTRVDGNLEGYPRQDGPFAKSPNYLYKVPAAQVNLRSGERWLLQIERGGGLPLVIADTEILGDIIPRETSPPNPVSMGYDRQITFAWSAPVAARIFDLRAIIRYRENTLQAPFAFQSKTVEWVLSRDILRQDNNERVEYNITGIAFYQFLASALAPDPGLRRIFDGMDILITGGGQEFRDYLQIARANIGLTSSQITPFYSNIREGRGLFSSRSTALRQGVQLSAESMDSLRNGRITRNLNFQ